ncbi:mdj1 protein precursor [Saitoella coloradoensis]
MNATTTKIVPVLNRVARGRVGTPGSVPVRPTVVGAEAPKAAAFYTTSNKPRPRSHNLKCLSEQRRSFHATAPTQAMKDPYQVLGVDKAAKSGDIKKAYYAAAKKYHPDTSKEPDAAAKFQEIQSSYEILSDAKKREQYDQFGAAAFEQGGGMGGGPGGGFDGFGGFGGFGGGQGGFGGAGGFNFEDLFGAFANGGMGGSRRNAGPVVGANIETEASISFLDSAKGTTVPLTVSTHDPCNTCSGSGLKSGAKRNTCGRCGGSGQIMHVLQGGFHMQTTCTSCGGAGVHVSAGSECKSCRGDGAIRARKTIKVDIPAGIEDGMTIKLAGEGDYPAQATTTPGVKARRGDMYVHVRVAPHPTFRRQGRNILYSATVPLTTAVLGGKIRIPTIEGEVDLKIPAGVSTGEGVVIGGRGMPDVNGGRAKGDFRVEFSVKTPKSLSPHQRQLFEQLAVAFGDKNAKVTTDFSSSTSSASSGGAQGNETAEKKDGSGGFFKKAFSKFTQKDGKEGGEETKKDSGSA